MLLAEINFCLVFSDEPVTEAYSVLGFPLGRSKRRSGKCMTPSLCLCVLHLHSMIVHLPFFLRKRSLTSSLCCLSSCVFAADTICRTCNQHFYLPHPEHDNTRKVCEICLYHCEMCDNCPIVLHPSHVNLLSES